MTRIITKYLWKLMISLFKKKKVCMVRKKFGHRLIGIKVELRQSREGAATFWIVCCIVTTAKKHLPSMNIRIFLTVADATTFLKRTGKIYEWSTIQKKNVCTVIFHDCSDETKVRALFGTWLFAYCNELGPICNAIFPIK